MMLRRLALSGVASFFLAVGYLNFLLVMVSPQHAPYGYWGTGGAIEADTWIGSALWTLLALGLAVLTVAGVVVSVERTMVRPRPLLSLEQVPDYVWQELAAVRGGAGFAETWVGWGGDPMTVDAALEETLKRYPLPVPPTPKEADEEAG